NPMNRSGRSSSLIGVACAFVLTATVAAQAQPQTPAQAQPQAQPAPQQTTATYEDWTLRCVVQPGPPSQKVCEIVQSTHVQGQAAVLTQIAIGGQKKAPLKVVVQVPIDVWLPAGIKLIGGGKDPGLAAAFKRCVPQACFA